MPAMPNATTTRAGRARRRLAALVLGASVLGGAAGAQAQSAGCTDIQKILIERKTIAASLNTGKKQIDAKFACNRFGNLVTNGTTLIKWAETNKDWCQIPDTFITGIKDDHVKAQSIRTKACGIAAKQAQMEKQARQQQSSGGGSGLLGGGGLSGDMRIPQGAM